jgi:predicted permease
LENVARTFTSGDVAERISVWEVTPGFLELLGIGTTVGRTAVPDEGHTDAPPTAVVGAGFALTRLGASPSDLGSVVGSTIRLDGVDHLVIGVLPERVGPVASRTQVFVTQRFAPPTRRGPFLQIVLGRLAPDVDPSAAVEELEAINRSLFPLWGDTYQDETARWTTAPLAELIHGDVDRLVVLLAGALGLLLVLATANSGTLLLSRVRSRSREMAVRVALGASRRRVVGHLVFDGLLLAVAGTAVAWPLAWGALESLPTIASSYIPRLDEAALGGRALAFACALAAFAAAFLGLVSSMHAPSKGSMSELRSGGRSASRSRREQRSQRILVSAQVALAVPLLFGAGLLASSLRNLQRADTGFDPSGLLTARVSLAEGRYPDQPVRRAFWHALEERIAGLPGVLAVGISDGRPPSEAYDYNNYDLEQQPTAAGDAQPVANWVSADEGFLEALGMPLLEGRWLTRDDETADESPVIVVDERWARRHFPNESAVGKRLREGGATDGPWTTVVGVVGEVPYAGFGGETGGTVYAPRTGLTEPFVVVRALGDPTELVAALRAELQRMDPTAPITDVETGESLLGSSLTEPRHLTFLLGAFALVAVLLAAVGLFGITAHWVQSRRADIAVRLALGGSPRRVLHGVVAHAMAISLGGLVLGASAAPAFTRLLARTLYGVDSSDLAILGSVLALMAAVSLAASAWPAWRAVRIDPGITLRQD